MLTLCSLEHFILTLVCVGREVSHVGNVHNARYVIACVAKIFFKNVLHNIRAQISYMSEMIDRRSAGIHTYLAFLVRNKFFSDSCCCVVYFHFSNPLFRFLSFCAFVNFIFKLFDLVFKTVYFLRHRVGNVNVIKRVCNLCPRSANDLCGYSHSGRFGRNIP